MRIAIFAGLLCLLVAGCTDQQTPQPETDSLIVYVQKLPDGRTVTCVRAKTKAGGLSCDWGR